MNNPGVGWAMWMWFVVIGAMAQEAADAELVVVGERLSRAKEALQQDLKERGYWRFRIGKRTWFINRKLWKPGVMVHDEGFARVRGRAALPIGVDVRRNDLRTKMATGHVVVQSRRKRRQQKAELVQSLEPHLRAIRDARWAMARPEREAALMATLSALWFELTDPEGRVLPDRAAVREAIFQRWLRTASGEAGQGMRALVERFVESKVQPTEDRYTEDEITSIQQRVPDDRDLPAWATPSP